MNHPVRTNYPCGCEAQVNGGGHGLMHTNSMAKSDHSGVHLYTYTWVWLNTLRVHAQKTTLWGLCAVLLNTGKKVSIDSYS